MTNKNNNTKYYTNTTAGNSGKRPLPSHKAK